MNKSRLSIAMLALAAMMTAIPAEAAGKKKGAANGAETPGQSMAPLTAGECERLGGSISSNPKCKGTGKQCFVSTLDNGDHSMCIDEAN